MYSRTYLLRYSDLDNKSKVRISTIIDLLQDVSISHSTYVGYGLKRLQDMSLAILLRGWRIKVLDQINHEKEVIATTGISKVQRCEVTRRYSIIQDNEEMVKATASWFFYDSSKGEIIRAPQSVNESFESLDEPDNGMPIKRICREEDMSLVAVCPVQRHNLDTNNHMNNVKSVELALDYMPEKFDASEYNVLYHKELKSDDTINVYIKTYQDKVVIELRNQADEVCVLVECVK